jgi:hypothetical protein
MNHRLRYALGRRFLLPPASGTGITSLRPHLPADVELPDGGQNIARTAKLEYVPHQRQGHCSGTACPLNPPRIGLSLPSALGKTAGKA